MAKTVVGLFETSSEAQAAQQELLASRFSAGDITMNEGRGASGIDSQLSSHGVPASDVQMYVSGVQSGDSLIVVNAKDDQADTALAILNRHGALDIADAHSVRTSTTTTAAPVMAAAATTVAATTAASAMTASNQSVKAGETVSIPVIEEQLAVGKRAIQRGGAKIHITVETVPVSAQVTLREEHVVVQRHAVNQPVDASTAFKEGTVEVTTREEVPVVSKTARVVEEVTIGKQATNRVETVTDTVRKTDVEVEEINTGVAATGAATTGSASRK